MLLVALVGALALALAWPVPLMLERARWTMLAPALALLLWQAIALGGGLAMIGSLLGLALLPFPGGLAEAALALAAHAWTGPLPEAVGAIHVAALAAAGILSALLLLTLVATALQVERDRRRHVSLVGLLGRADPDRPGTVVLDHPVPVAYCLPGMTTVTVLSEGLLDALPPRELDAVLAHETTHLRQHHHLVLLAFRAWNRALPWFPIANRAERSVSRLVELLADDQAVREVDREVLASAVERIGSAWGAAEASGHASGRAVVDRTMLEIRRTRLTAASSVLPPTATLGVLLTATAIVAFPAISVLTFISGT
ncbi:integral membrane protein [Agromyces rhizosphaerae]|uniref:Integral membrane protein n=1 Tax=Agromyces rhizosphaerae TaxID=88374 RepID=A0A9W6FR02_9MICO|nr:M56 family metallopeptidase [Agromyces rhizosphaerae]GLI29055.1 integral membrane protein [Agromyces rhizosphaerae]